MEVEFQRILSKVRVFNEPYFRCIPEYIRYCKVRFGDLGYNTSTCFTENGVLTINTKKHERQKQD